MRLIDADALLKDFAERQELDRSGGDYADCFMNSAQELSTEWWCVEDHVESAPTIDAVPVVRCRDCKYWSGRTDKPGEVTAIGYCNHPNHHIMPLNAGWFCADGTEMD